MTHRRLLAAAVLAVAFLSASGVRAQSEEERRALARSLFEEGLAFGEGEQWADAADRFRRAYELLPSPGIAVNLASALIPTGRLVEASELLRVALEDASTPGNVRRLARSLLEDEVLPEIARLTVRLEGDAAGVRVTRNGEDLPSVAIGIAAPADPGETTVAIHRGEHLIESQTVMVESGGSAEVTFYVPEAVPEPVVVARREVARPRPLEEESDGGVAGQWWFWAGIGVVVAVGVVLAVVLLSSEEAVPPVGGNTSPPFLEGVVMP